MSTRVRTDDGRIVEFASAADLWTYIEQRARVKYPERHASDGTPLLGLDGETWAEKLRAWQDRYEEPPIPDEVASS